MSRIYLIGYPCSGKTTYGEYLSKELKYPIYDLDKEFHNKYEMTPEHCINELGEGVFRIWETELLEDFIERDEKDYVMSCGGGTPCFFNNIDKILNDGEVLYLKLPWYKLYWRLLFDKTRPLSRNKFLLPITLFKLYKKREKIYKKAHRILKFNKDFSI